MPDRIYLLAANIRPFGYHDENTKYTEEYTDKIIKIIFPRLEINNNQCQEIVRALTNPSSKNPSPFLANDDYINAFRYFICFFNYHSSQYKFEWVEHFKEDDR